MKKSKLLSISLACLLGLGTVSTAVSVFSKKKEAPKEVSAIKMTSTDILTVSDLVGKTSYGNFTWTAAPNGTCNNPWSGSRYWNCNNNATLQFTWKYKPGYQVTEVTTFNFILKSSTSGTNAGTALNRYNKSQCGIYSYEHTETYAGRSNILITRHSDGRTPQRAEVTFIMKNVSGQNGYLITQDDGKFNAFKVEYEPITTTVTLQKRNGTGGDSSVSVDYNSAMPTITVPTRAGYVFQGYFDATSGGTQYYKADGKSAHKWDKDSLKSNLYAQWTPAQYTVSFNSNGGSAVADKLVTYDSTYGELATPTRTAYRFDGWYKESTFVNLVTSSTQVTSTANHTLYAKWTLMQFDVTLDAQGGSDGTSKVTATFGEDMPAATMPTREGYTFAGYYDAIEGGTKYYNADGTSASTFDKTENTTLYAHWDPLSYEATFESSPGTGGPTKIDVTYDAELPSLQQSEIPTLASSGGFSYSFGGYYTEEPTSNGDGTFTPHGTKYYDKDGNGVGVWKEASDTVLYAYYTVDMSVSSSGYSGVWDGQEHGISVDVNFPTGAVTYYGDSALTCNNSNASDFFKSVAGSYCIYYEVRKDGYTPYSGSETIEILKDSSCIDPIPTIAEGLEYTGSPQKLIDTENPGVADYGNMLYALSSNKEVLPEDSAFSNEIPTATNVGEYFVFYKTSGDDNHNPVAASLDNYVTVTISRVDRSEVIELNDEVNDFLDIYEERYPSICETLENVRAEVYADAIVEDNINVAGVSENVAKLEEAYKNAKLPIVESLINALGDISYPESKEAIEEAYDLFTNGLSEDEKALVDNDLVAILEHDKEVLDHIDEVAGKINNLPEAAQDQDYYDAVDDAKASYNELSNEEKAIINGASDVDYETVLDNNVNARNVIEQIQNIGDVTYDGGVDDSKDDIANAEAAYDALPEAAKAIVDSANHDDLKHNREVYDNVEETVALINEIGSVSHSEESKNKLDTARTSYDELSDEEKALVKGYNSSYKTLDDNEHVFEAMVLIDKIGEVGYSSESEEDIKAAREYIDSLSEDQRQLLGLNHIKVLEEAEQTYTAKKKGATTMVIIFFILIGILLVLGLLLMRKILKDRVKKEVKAMSVSILPVILASNYITGPFLVLYIIIGATVLVWLCDLLLAVLRKKEKWIFNPNRVKVIPAEAPKDGDEEIVRDEKGNLFQIRYVKSFTAKLIQAPEETKKYYEELKNFVLSFTDTRSRVSWHYDSITANKNVVMKFSVRGKTLTVYLPLDADSYKESKYKVEKISNKRFEETPCIYRIKNDRRLAYAKELIALVCKKLGLEKGLDQKKNYIFPYEPNKPLLERGLIKERRVKLNKPEEVIETKVDAEGDEIVTTKDTSGHVYKTRFVKSISAKLSEANEEEKLFYNELKNHLLSFEKVTSRLSFDYDSFNVGRKQLVKLGIRRKTLCVYYALDVDKVPQKYKVEKIESSKYDEVSCMYRIDSKKKCENAKQLITNLMRKNHIIKVDEKHEEYTFPHEERDVLVKKGLIRKHKILVK